MGNELSKLRSERLDYNSLRIFVVSANKGSFTLAARSLGVPLPTVSRRILELERDLGAQLFDRTPKGCAVTDAGVRLLARVGPGIEMLNEFESNSHLVSPEVTGKLRLSLPQSFGPWWKLLGMYQRANPGIKISVYSTERRVDLLADGVDVALRVGAISDDTLVARYLGDFRHILVASRDLAGVASHFSQPSDISELPCAAWGSTMDEKPVWRLGGSSVKVDAALMVNDYLHLRDRALAGEFLTELPSFLAAEDLKTGRLIEVLPAHPFPRSPLHLVYRKLRYPLATIRSYIDFCIENFPKFIETWDVQPGQSEALE